MIIIFININTYIKWENVNTNGYSWKVLNAITKKIIV
ncbi:MAG: hypothetical protein H6Q16_1569 [Bacteroidetes bacterium]|nr:hypothetical protein [Bacteroidota bacterium]